MLNNLLNTCGINFMYLKEDVKTMFGKGYHKLIDKLYNRLKPEQIMGIKPKYGRIDIYVSGTEEEQDFAYEIEKESQETCEECGEKGTQTETNGWITTLCDKCYKK